MKRIVLEYTQGPLAGMLQIGGLLEEVSPFIQGPFSVGPAGQVIKFASLVAVKQRYVHYREVMDRSTAVGKFGDGFPRNFDPRQV